MEVDKEYEQPVAESVKAGEQEVVQQLQQAKEKAEQS